MNKPNRKVWMLLGESLLFTPLCVAVRARRGGIVGLPEMQGRVGQRLLYGLWWTVLSTFFVPVFITFFVLVLQQQHGAAMLAVFVLSLLLPLQIHILWHFIAAWELAMRGAVGPGDRGIPKWYQRIVHELLATPE